MSFPECLKQNPSNADIAVTIELQHRRLAQYILPDRAIIFYKNHVEIMPKEKVTYEMVESAEGLTVPDHVFQKLNGRIVATYLDGPPHKQQGVANRDDRINRLLEKHRITYKRFPYRVPLRKARLNEICEKIRDLVMPMMGNPHPHSQGKSVGRIEEVLNGK